MHGDVFRAPAAPALLSVLVGAGGHMLTAAVGLLVMFSAGLYSPELRDTWLKDSVFMCLYLSFFAADYSVGLWRSLKRDSATDSGDRVVGVWAVLIFPGAVFSLTCLPQCYSFSFECVGTQRIPMSENVFGCVADQ